MEGVPVTILHQAADFNEARREKGAYWSVTV